MKYLSLFSGIGGFELGIQQAYENNRKLLQGKKATDIRENSTDNKSRQNGVTCIGYSEIDKYAIQVYEKHFNHKNYGDITTINPKELPDFDLIVGGFPCQSFSIAGKRGGFSDTRGTLFFDIVRIIREKQPRLLLLENVKGLLSHDQGRTFYTIISTLNEVGYDLQWQVLNSKNHGVPQNRERVFIVGHLRGTSRPEVFPIGEDDQLSNGQDVSKERQPQAEISTTVRDGMGNKADSTFVNVKEATKKGYAEANEGDSINLSVPNSKTRRGRVGKGIAQTLDTGMQQHTLKDAKIRRLTPTECERLQGFPNGWTEGVSDTQRYKCLGNAVTVNVIQAIMEKLYKIFNIKKI